MELKKLKATLEALLLASDKPLTVQQIKEVTQAESTAIKRAAAELEGEYTSAERGFRRKEIAGGYQLVTDPDLAGPVKEFVRAREKKRLSQASLETLSIAAFHQPITRAEIEFIRGVNVEGAIHTLLEKGLLRISGRKDAPGRPILYSTTQSFLDHFGLGSLRDLPKLAEFTEKDIELPESLQVKASETEAVPTMPHKAEAGKEGTDGGS